MRVSLKGATGWYRGGPHIFFGVGMSKGSKPRPVDRKKFDENFDRIFGKKRKK